MDEYKRQCTVEKRRYKSILRSACQLVLEAAKGDALRALGLLYALRGQKTGKEYPTTKKGRREAR